ncbi:hypothetical protein EI94DRAFT_1702094 [Lactarius quietus]|nr:hypothetical protein EI94DRAFT_1702094 [Lactarius quietus]
MPNLHPSLSPLGAYIAHLETTGDQRDSELSPESEESSGMAAETLPQSQHSFGMDVGLPEGGPSDLGMDLPPSPEDQISAGSNEDWSFDDKSDFGMDDSPSPQSQHSFSIDSLSLPKDEGHLGGSGGYFPNVHVHQTEHAPSQLDVTLRKEAEPHPGPRQFDIADTPRSTKKIGVDFPQPTEAEQPTGEASAACEVWKWGEPAPSSFSMGPQEPPESATAPVHQEAHGDTLEPVRRITFWQQDDGITPAFRSILLLRDEMKRLCHVKNRLIDIYKRDLDLLAVMNQMVDSLDDADVQNIVCLIGRTLRTMPVRDTNKNGHNALYMLNLIVAVNRIVSLCIMYVFSFARLAWVLPIEGVRSGNGPLLKPRQLPKIIFFGFSY